MKSYLESLLLQAEPLEPHEVADLALWLDVLKEDVATFGTTPEDEVRMKAIAAKVAGAIPSAEA